jgi:benzoate/toluate 1,2-dioxygenase alpha subunit
MATPDDLEEFRACQLGFLGEAAQWNDMTRGVQHWLDGPDEVAQTLGMDGVISAGQKNEDEGLYPIQHEYWQQVMRSALEQETADGSERDSTHAKTEV